MSLDKKRKEVELMRVRVAKQEMELRIEERMEEVARLQEHIKVQDQKINDLEKELESLGG